MTDNPLSKDGKHEYAFVRDADGDEHLAVRTEYDGWTTGWRVFAVVEDYQLAYDMIERLAQSHD